MEKKKKNRFIGILSVYTINLNVVNLAYSFFTFLDICWICNCIWRGFIFVNKQKSWFNIWPIKKI